MAEAVEEIDYHDAACVRGSPPCEVLGVAACGVGRINWTFF